MTNNNGSNPVSAIPDYICDVLEKEFVDFLDMRDKVHGFISKTLSEIKLSESIRLINLHDNPNQAQLRDFMVAADWKHEQMRGCSLINFLIAHAERQNPALIDYMADLYKKETKGV